MFLVISASLHPDSRSRILGKACTDLLATNQQTFEWFDLAEKPLPICDGNAAYGDPNVQELSGLVRAADAIFLASPVYNYDLNAAAKNAIELTGRSWTDKVVAMLLAAGGGGSYMSPMSLASSLMLDFHCLIVPRFVYATGAAFEGSTIIDDNVTARLDQLVKQTTFLAQAVTKYQQ